LRAAGKAVDMHLDYVEYLLDHRRWLGGATFGLADIAAAAHISVADYLNGVDWAGHAQAKQWYSAIKSRPTFRPLLAEKMDGLAPPPHYDKLDF
jgi:glutathione S-transferase